ncbi:bifunctional UDP-N-acetylglucosamine diphosphorylase/glucosamine-1-phosphate N-acetyltransferase GlmU [Porticoccus sp.]
MVTDVVVLAAGKGTRMKSELPKVLHGLAGRPLLQHVIDTAGQLSEAHSIVVTGHGTAEVTDAIKTNNVTFVVQNEQLGTAHAVLQALPKLRKNSTVLILYGDVPLIDVDTLTALISEVTSEQLALLTVELPDPFGYGRILRDDAENIVAIIEEKDATPEQRRIREVNTGVLALSAEMLRAWLPLVGNDNAQREYYLTDLIGLAYSHGVRIQTLHPKVLEEVQGVNNRQQLAELERFYQRQQALQLMLAGVTLADPQRFDIRGEISTGTDNFIDINVVIEGKVVFGSGIKIGPNCQIINSVIGDNVEIKANTIIEDSQLAPGCVVGPFARLRPGTILEEGAKVGNFVEMKKTTVGKYSKINHLSYIGDAVVGADVNVGAGTITCNYDGVNKHRTEIGDSAFIGSNTSLVAPVRVGKKATVGAGSTITQDVPDEQLGLTRAEQKNISGWQRPVKKT